MAGHLRMPTFKLLLAGASFAALLASVPPAQAEVGVAAAVNRDARSRPPSAPVRVVTLGQKVVFNEEVTTDPSGQVQILLLDGTTFTVGPNSNITIDEFVFNPSTGQAKVVASVTKGAFRFIGARTSETPGGATIDAPVGTIGVRGGSVICGVVDSEILCAMPFGKEVSVVGKDGVKHRLYKPGWLLAFDLNGNYIETRKASLRELGGLNAALQGKGKGGAITPPNDRTVAGSEVPATNSNLPNTIPVSVILEAVKANPRLEQVENDIAQDLIEQDIINNEPEPEPTTLALRVLTSQEGEGDSGIVGTTPDTNQVLTFIQQGGRLISAVGGYDLPDYTGSQGDTNLNENGFPQLDQFDIGPGGDSQASSADGPLEGVAYAGVGDFAAYFLGQAPSTSGMMAARALPEPAEPVYVIVGTATPDAMQDSMLNGGSIRRYTLTPDSIQDGPVPFFNSQEYGVIDTGPSLSSSDFYVAEGNQPDSQESKGFQSWVHIEGTGANQRSAIGVNVGTVAKNGDDQLEFLGERGGSYSTATVAGDGVEIAGTLEISASMSGQIGSVASGGGGHVFGPDGNHMVLGNRTSPNGGAFQDNVLTGSSQDFGTMHVATLADKDPQSSFTRVSEPTERRGFMSGMAESSSGEIYILTNAPSEENYGEDEGYSNVAQPNLTIRKSPETNEFSAQAQLHDASTQFSEGTYYGTNDEVSYFQITWGNHAEGSNGESAYIDETKFGATQDKNGANTTLTTDDRYVYVNEDDEGYTEYESSTYSHSPSKSPETYIVSGRANPVAGYQHCTCAFIDWGWWGSKTTFDGDENLPNGRTDQVHMGTWVAGDITDPEKIYGENGFTGSATYAGTALGTVARPTSDGVVTYQASGKMGMEFDFSARQGTLAITEFDSDPSYNPGGYNVSGTMYDASSGTEALFAGELRNDNDPYYQRVGGATGAFVDDNLTGQTLNRNPAAPNVAAGVMGNFDFGIDGTSVTGTFAGEMTGYNAGTSSD